MKKLIVMTMLAALMVGCSRRDKIETAFYEYAETENIPNYKGIKSIECTDTIPYEELANIPETEAQIDSVKTLLTDKVNAMMDYVKTLSHSQGERIINEVARIGAEYGEICVKDLDLNNGESVAKLKEALDEVSPYKEPLHIYHIVAKIGGRNDISFYGFSCGEDISFVKADDKGEAVLKNKKLAKLFNAMQEVISAKIVPHSMLIDDIDKIMDNGN